jgi:hypothetical protein
MYTLLHGLLVLFHSVCIYVYICVYVYVCVFVCECVCIPMYVCLYTHTHKPNHTYEFRNDIKKLWVTCSRICKTFLRVCLCVFVCARHFNCWT